MERKFDQTVIFFIGMLKKQGKIKTWDEGAAIYFNIVGKNINRKTISSQVANINFDEVNLQRFYTICEKYKIEEPKEEVEEPKEEKRKSALIKTLSIPIKDYEKVFGIDPEKDSEEEINLKIMNKISSDDGRFLLTYLGFNPGEYEIRKITIGSWSTPVKIGKDNQLVVVLNDKFNIEIVKRKSTIPYYTEEECKRFLEEFLKEKKISPFDLTEEQEVLNNPLRDNLMLVCPGLELHLGKLGTVADFEDYSAKQSMWRIKKVTKELAKYQEQVKASRLLLGIGNDYYNTDTTKDETTAGTPQNNDTRFKECYLWGKVGYLRMIETLKPYFDKIVLQGMPGNHDEKTSFTLLTNLYDIYSMTEDPKVDTSLSYRDLRFSTAYEYGDNLIVFFHGKAPEGKNIKDSEIAKKITMHFPEECRRAKKIYIFAGHLHTDSEQLQDDPRIMVIRTASLSGVESWAYSNNYIGQREGHTVYLFDKKLGYMGKHNITLSDEDKKEKITSVARNENANVPKAMEKALDLSTESVEKSVVEEEKKEIDRKIRELRKKYLQSIKAFCISLGVDYSKLDDATVDKLLSSTTYETEVRSLEKRKEAIMTYKRFDNK